MKAPKKLIAYHIILSHPEDKIIFWKDMELGTFQMVFEDFLMDGLHALAYCLLPDRMEIAAKSNKALTIEELGENLRNIMAIYDQFFGPCAEDPSLLPETRWTVRKVGNHRELREIIGSIHSLPVDRKLVEKAHEWEHSTYIDYRYEEPGLIEPSLIRDIIRDIQGMPDLPINFPEPEEGPSGLFID